VPTYEYECQVGHVVEMRRPVDQRDDPVECLGCTHIPGEIPTPMMKRRLTAGMAVIWNGKFHDPWAQKKPDALGDRTW